MFDWLIGSEVNDDAIRLMLFADITLKKYSELSFTDIAERISHEFPAESIFIDKNNANFIYPEIPDFQFSFDAHMLKEGRCSLSIHGRGRYAGLFLQTSDGGKEWIGSAEDGIAIAATGGARKMIKVLEKKFGVCDMEKLMRGFIR